MFVYLVGFGFYVCSYFVFLSDSGCQEHSVKGVGVTSVRAEWVGSGAASAQDVEKGIINL